jgi:hypothetical protein
LQKRKSCKKEKVVGVTLKFPTLQRSISDSDYVVLIPLSFLSLLTTLLLLLWSAGRQAGRQASRVEKVYLSSSFSSLCAKMGAVAVVQC